MPVHDLKCSKCSMRIQDLFLRPWPEKVIHFSDGGEFILTFENWGKKRAGWHEKDKVVVWEGPNGEVNYPDRNDRAIPERLRARGFVRKEMASLREVEKFEKEHNVRNERMWYDSNGRGFESNNKFGV